MMNDVRVRDTYVPGESAAMKVLPRNRWQVLLMEYELLDSYGTTLHQRIWMSALVLIGLSMVGVTFLAAGVSVDESEVLGVIGLVGTVASLITVGWWLLQRRLSALQEVGQYRKREIERELGMRTEIYLGFLRQSRHLRLRRRGTSARLFAEGDEVLEGDLQAFAASPESKPWFPRLMSERLVWNLVPWLLIAAWGVLYAMRA